MTYDITPNLRTRLGCTRSIPSLFHSGMVFAFQKRFEHASGSRRRHQVLRVVFPASDSKTTTASEHTSHTRSLAYVFPGYIAPYPNSRTGITKSIILQPECILICEHCRTMADIGHRDRLQHHRPQDWRCHGNRQVVCDRGLDALLRLGRGIGDNTTEGNCGHRLKKKGSLAKEHAQLSECQ